MLPKITIKGLGGGVCLMRQNKNKVAKFVETDYSRILQCQLNLISITQSRTGLIEIYKACQNVITQEDIDTWIIPSCRDRQAYLLDSGIISL